MKAPQWALNESSLNVAGQERTFSYYLPEDISEFPSLIFVLHGSRGTVGIMRYLTNYAFEKAALREKDFILVYPQGYDKHWNDCRASATYRAKTEHVDDIAFFQAMISYFKAGYGINERAVFATGYSNGAHMCMKLAYEMPEAIRGVALFAANAPDTANNDCHLKGLPVSVLIINGTSDPINPYHGGPVVLDGDSSRGNVYSSQATMQYWANLLPCPIAEAKATAFRPDIDRVQVHCPDGSYRVELVTVKEGGHTLPLPDPAPYLPAKVGSTNTNINSVSLVVDFFEDLREADSKVTSHRPTFFYD